MFVRLLYAGNGRDQKYLGFQETSQSILFYRLNDNEIFVWRIEESTMELLEFIIGKKIKYNLTLDYLSFLINDTVKFDSIQQI